MQRRLPLATALLLVAASTLLGVSVALDANATASVSANATTTRLRFLHAFDADANGSVVATLQRQQAEVSESKPQLVVVTTPQQNTTSPANSSSLAGFEPSSFAGDGRIAFRPDLWDATRDSALNGSVWTRLKTKLRDGDGGVPSVCVVVLPAASSMDSPLLLQIAARVDSFCAPQDAVLLGFTAPLADALAQYLTGETVVNGQYAPRIMTELDAFTHQADSQLSNASQAAVNRLFFSFPTAACLEDADATAPTADSDAGSSQSVALCAGAGCTRCVLLPGTNSPESVADGSDRKHGLVVLVSCGSFLIGCALVFYVFFRNQFFLPGGATKPEKDLTANLAYVLRM